jgi:hypothetical protein
VVGKSFSDKKLSGDTDKYKISKVITKIKNELFGF